MRAGGHRLRAGIAAAGHGLRAGKLPGRAPASGGPRHALCAIGAAASRTRRLRARPPRAGRSSLGGLLRGRWAGRAPFGGWGRCGRLFSAPPMCQAGWSRGPWWLGRCRVLSGGDLNPPGPSGRPPQAGGLRRRNTAAQIPKKQGIAHIFAKYKQFTRFSAKIECLCKQLKTLRPCCARPIPPPFPAREGGEGSRFRSGGDPLRRDGGCSHRTVVFYRPDPYHIASRMRSADKGRWLPPVSTTHAQEAARVVDGETRGCEARGAGCRGRGPPCGPPG